MLSFKFHSSVLAAYQIANYTNVLKIVPLNPGPKCLRKPSGLPGQLIWNHIAGHQFGSHISKGVLPVFAAAEGAAADVAWINK